MFTIDLINQDSNTKLEPLQDSQYPVFIKTYGCCDYNIADGTYQGFTIQQDEDYNLEITIQDRHGLYQVMNEFAKVLSRGLSSLDPNWGPGDDETGDISIAIDLLSDLNMLGSF